jgi:hypothetical protein
MRKRPLLLAAALAAPLALHAADARAWTPLDASAPTWGDLPVAYKINQSTIPNSISAIGVARVDEGFAQWTSPACTAFSVQNLGSTNSSYNFNDGQNTILWRSASWPNELGDVSSVIGVTLPVTFQNGDLADADIVFNDVGFCWDDSGAGNCVDTKSIATHEEGHLLGLGHSNVNGATMEAFYPGGKAQASVAQDDIDGVCALYPIGGSSAVSSGSGGLDCPSCADASTSGACSGPYNACGSSQACIDFYYCIADCADQPCVDDCVAQYPNGVDIYVDMIDCICSDCATECSAECGGSSSSSSSTGSSGETTATTATSSAEATTGSGEVATGAGGSGSGATGGSGGSDDGSSGSWGDDEDEDDGGREVREVSACALGSAPVGPFAAALLASLMVLGVRRKRR